MDKFTEWMNEIRQVERFETPDGQTFPNIVAAQRYQARQFIYHRFLSCADLSTVEAKIVSEMIVKDIDMFYTAAQIAEGRLTNAIQIGQARPSFNSPQWKEAAQDFIAASEAAQEDMMDEIDRLDQAMEAKTNESTPTDGQ